MSAASLNAPAHPLTPFAAILGREIKRFLRQPTRLAGALATPVLIWIVLGSGFAGSFTATAPGQSDAAYSAYLVPGMAAMTVLFTAILAAMSLIEDRHAGFLQSILISPAPAWSALWAKLAATALLALAQGSLIILASPLAGLPLTIHGFALGLLALTLMCTAVSGLGLALAWKIDSAQGFHGIMSALLMPMLLLSGAFFPVESSSPWLSIIMKLNPMTWPTECLRSALLGHTAPALWASWAGAAVFAAAGLALPLVARRTRRYAQP